MLSYCVEKLPSSVVSIFISNARIVYCYENDLCIHTRVFSTYEEAEAFGIEYLDSVWNIYGFPPCSYVPDIKVINSLYETG